MDFQYIVDLVREHPYATGVVGAHTAWCGVKAAKTIDHWLKGNVGDHNRMKYFAWLILPFGADFYYGKRTGLIRD